MRILFVHNCYGNFSGEEAVVNTEVNLLRDRGHSVRLFSRESSELKGISGKIKGFFAGVYNPFSKHSFRKAIDSFQPDIIHIHNLYPLINPCVLDVARKKNIPVVMTLHNYRLLCPSGLFFRNGRICEQCLGSELHCFFNNCEKSFFKSLGYSIRALIARKMKWYRNNVSHYIALSEFQKKKISNALNWKEFNCSIIPNPLNLSEDSSTVPVPENGYIACAGRVSQEKGYYVVKAVAERLPHIPFRWAGQIKISQKELNEKPANLDLLGPLSHDKMNDFYSCSKFFIMPSQCYEGFPISLGEGMQKSRAAIVSKIAALPELVPSAYQEQCTVPPDDIDGWCQAISSLYQDTSRCESLGNEFRAFSNRLSEDNHYDSLICLYTSLLQN